MSISAPPAKPKSPWPEDHSPITLDELEAMADDDPRLQEPLPQWVAEAHLRYLQTGEGDPWGGYFS